MSEEREFALKSAAARIAVATNDLRSCAERYGGDFSREISALAEIGAELVDELKQLASE